MTVQAPNKKMIEGSKCMKVTKAQASFCPKEISPPNTAFYQIVFCCACFKIFQCKVTNALRLFVWLKRSNQEIEILL